jgi:hypothetical protein
MRHKKRARARPPFSSTAACKEAIRNLFANVAMSLEADPDIDCPVKHACRLFGAQIREVKSRLPQKPSKSSRAMAKRDAALLARYEAATRSGRGKAKVLERFAEKHKLGTIRKGPVVLKGEIRTKPSDIAKRIMLREKKRQQQIGQKAN